MWCRHYRMMGRRDFAWKFIFFALACFGFIHLVGLRYYFKVRRHSDAGLMSTHSNVDFLISSSLTTAKSSDKYELTTSSGVLRMFVQRSSKETPTTLPSGLSADDNNHDNNDNNKFDFNQSMDFDVGEVIDMILSTSHYSSKDDVNKSESESESESKSENEIERESESESESENQSESESESESEEDVNVVTSHTTNPPALVYRLRHANESSKHFQSVDHGLAWIYSAFYDEGHPARVRIVGMAVSFPNEDLVFCHFETADGEFMSTSRAIPLWFGDAHQLSVRAIELRCFIEGNGRPAIVKVSRDQKPAFVSNRLKVHYAGRRVRNFTVCISPLHTQYNNVWQLVETIEFNRLLGAEHFLVYNFSMTKQVEAVLQGYQDEGIVTFIPWPFYTIKIWYFGQIMAITDCILRSRNVSQYTVITDADEVIVPNLHDNWWDMLQDIYQNVSMRDLDIGNPDKFAISVKKWHQQTFREKINVTTNAKSAAAAIGKSRPVKPVPKAAKRGARKRRSSGVKKSGETQTAPLVREVIRKTYGTIPGAKQANVKQIDAFSFRCAFFVWKPLNTTATNVNALQSVKFDKNQMAFLDKFPLTPARSLLRNTIPFCHGYRSKLIVRPEIVNMAGIHNLLHHNIGYGTAYVKADVALLHHYRDYKPGDCNFVDTSALRFKDKLIEAMRKAIAKFPLLSKLRK